jgi:hypothetical protein
VNRIDPHHAADELTTLSGFLDYQRATLLHKCDGLIAEQLRLRLPTSTLTLAGLLTHLALVEDVWIQVRFLGLPEREPWAGAPWDENRDWEFHTAVHDDPDELRDLYMAACDRSRLRPGRARSGRSSGRHEPRRTTLEPAVDLEPSTRRDSRAQRTCRSSAGGGRWHGRRGAHPVEADPRLSLRPETGVETATGRARRRPIPTSSTAALRESARSIPIVRWTHLSVDDWTGLASATASSESLGRGQSVSSASSTLDVSCLPELWIQDFTYAAMSTEAITANAKTDSHGCGNLSTRVR